MYLNIAEIESGLVQAESNHPSLVDRFALPHVTHDNNTSHAIKIADGDGPGRVGVYLMGGIHAREWMNPDALINFTELLLQAFDTNSGITIGANNFSAGQIQTIVSSLDIFVFPLSNPDGRFHSQNVSSSWRKNRRPHPDGGSSIGVDLNRNFDFLWNYPDYYDARLLHGDDCPSTSNGDIVSSTGESCSTYIGPSPASEPETMNIVSILDDNPQIRFFIDVHSYSELILFDWGLDESQTTDLQQNFRNSDFHGDRGVAGDSYAEYVNPNDSAVRQALGNSMNDAIQNTNGNSYNVTRSFNLYPTSGTSTDYAASRSYVDPTNSKIHAFTIESGSEFQPDLPTRLEVIDEVTAALIRFCLEVTELPSDIYIRDNLQDSGEEPLFGGGISRSPDINHYPTELANPIVTLGSDAARNQGDLFEKIEIGQTNFIYIRLQNNGFQPDNAEIDVYWMPPSTLPAPGSWNLIGTIDANNILPGEFRVAGPLEWNSVPSKGHYCFVGVIRADNEPSPDIGSISSLDDFHNFIRQSNNVTWKNFEVDDMVAGAMALVHFHIQGWSRIAIESELEIDLSSLPGNTETELKILKRITENAPFNQMTVDHATTLYNFMDVNANVQSQVERMELQPSEDVQATLKIILPEDIPDGVYDIAVIQRVNGLEMGRITRRLNVGQFPFIGNRNTKELHRRNCPWVPFMASKNKVAYGELELGLKHGYDGCHTCLLEFDHG